MLKNRDNVLGEAAAFGRFLIGLPRYLRTRMSYDEARAIVLEQLRNREANFLGAVRRGVFENPGSPYLPLFELAGCEFGDLEHSVRTLGLEPTLLKLRHEGVYVSFEEFKGRMPIVRGGREIPTGPGSFDNPNLKAYYTTSTSGSSGPPRRALMDLTVFQARLPWRILSAHHHGTIGTRNIRWVDLPPAAGLQAALNDVPLGRTGDYWFTTTWGGKDGTSRRFLWAVRAALSVARLSGGRPSWPRHLTLDRPEVIARLAGELLRKHGRVQLRGSMSRLLRVSLAAQREGIDLTGAVMHGGGEPPSPAKLAGMRACGATFLSSYHFTEAGPVGYGCTDSTIPNDQHFMANHLAMIQVPRTLETFDLEVKTLSVTTLLHTAHKQLINVEVDDYCDVETRKCGCPWGELGLDTHISGIRSFAKLTGEGVTMVGSDMERIIEEVLPATFGGSLLDYQLVEEEDEKGFTRLVLRVSPDIKLSDDRAPADLVYKALESDGAHGRSTASFWRGAGTILVRREAPQATGRGKYLPLHRLRNPSRATVGSVS